MFSQVRAINDYVLVELMQQESTTSSGIIIPADYQDQSQVKVGKVVHAGKSQQVQVNDTVLLKRYIGHELDKNYMMLREEDILGVL